MRQKRCIGFIAILIVTGLTARGELPPAPAQWAEWPITWGAAPPGAMDASSLLDKPAGVRGPISVRGDHFFSGNQRIRFWGVNFAFSACFPTHEQADAVALRLARFGINAVRIHHADMPPFTP